MNYLDIWTENNEEAKAELVRFRDAVKGEKENYKSDLSLDTLLPEFLGVQKTFTEETAGNWYDWRIENWGTKWDVEASLDDDQLDLSVPQLVYSFSSAWAPPGQWVITISSQFPLLVFRLEYGESGCDFEGYLEVKNGEVIDSCQGKYVPSHWGEEDEVEEDIDAEPDVVV
jgi:hypothetical protein